MILASPIHNLETRNKKKEKRKKEKKKNRASGFKTAQRKKKTQTYKPYGFDCDLNHVKHPKYDNNIRFDS